MVNVEFLIVSYIVSMFIDWIFQWQWQAMNKSKWGKNDDQMLSFKAVFSHSMVYAYGTTLILLLLKIIELKAFTFVSAVLLLTHWAIDTRIPVKWIMKFKGMSDDQINDHQNYGFMHIGIDHRLHELVLLILSILI